MDIALAFTEAGQRHTADPAARERGGRHLLCPAHRRACPAFPGDRAGYERARQIAAGKRPRSPSASSRGICGISWTRKASKRPACWAFPDGGNIALTFALDYPDRVDRLILNGANLDPSGVKPSVQIPIVLDYCLATVLARVSPRAGRKAELLGLMVREPHIPPSALGHIAAPALGDRRNP